MAKIKKKYRYNLPQLIEWAWNSALTSKSYYGTDGTEVLFGQEGEVHLLDAERIGEDYIGRNVCTFCRPPELFEVEDEVIVDMNTEIPYLVVVYHGFDGQAASKVVLDKSIRNVVDDVDVISIHYLDNTDGTLQMLWSREEGLN